MIELKERWSGRDQGETYQLIRVLATVSAPVQYELMTDALRVATGSATVVHPRDWPPHGGNREFGSLTPSLPEGVPTSRKEREGGESLPLLSGG